MSAERTRWERVVFLAPFLSHLTELALARKAAYTQDPHDFNPDRWLLGALAEKAYSIVTGLPMNEDPHLDGGDIGWDFSDGADVKGVPYWNYPLLMRHASKPLLAPFFVLVALDVFGVRARLIGYATRREVFDAPQEDYRFGPTRVLRPEQLHPLPVPERRARPR